MRNSEKISANFDMIIHYLERAQTEMMKLPVEFVNQASIVDLFNQVGQTAADVEELQYETCAPLEMEENERDEEIKVLERRLAELKSSR